jgi:hypothetical protein
VPPPTLTDLSANAGKATDTVIISGVNLATVLSLASTPPGVTFGATAAATLGAHNDSSITVTAPAGTGTVPITVNGDRAAWPATPLPSEENDQWFLATSS